MSSFETPAPITVEIRNAHGEITVELGDVSSTTVNVDTSRGHPLGFLSDLVQALPSRWRGPLGETENDTVDPVNTARVEFDAENSVLVVDTEPATHRWGSAFAVRVVAPAGSGVRVFSQSADVEITGLTGKLDVRTASGDIGLRHVGDGGRAVSASGDIRVDRAEADLELRSASGDLHVLAVAGNVMLHSTSGNIDLRCAESDVSARSVSGNVTVGDARSGRAELAAISGNVEIGVHSGTLAFLELATVTGDARSELEVTDSAPQGTQAVLGIVAKTTSGDIRVRRAA